MLKQIEHVEGLYKENSVKKQRFSISVPRASYIAEALVDFSKELGKEPVEIFYKETNSQRTINNILNHDYKLGIIRYAENYDKFFKTMLEENKINLVENEYVQTAIDEVNVIHHKILFPGCGPRHLVFTENGNTACLITELSNNIVSLKYCNGHFEQYDQCSSLPEKCG